jgi:alkylation response protein AidB-like acyl-CoA dehydrogenase
MNVTITSTALIEPTDLPSHLRPAIEAACDEIDRRAELPDELRTALRDAGAFRLMTPREYGGFEAPLTELLEIYEGFGRIDASVGLLVWNANFGFIGALLSEAGAAKIWDGEREPILANSAMPGMAEQVDGGYRLTGQWRIVSGVSAADWVVVVAVVGHEVRACAVHRSQLTVDNSWDVSGMRGTASNGFVVENAFIPDELMSPPFDQPARIDRPLYRMFPAMAFPGCSAVVLGVAQAAIDEVVTLAAGKMTVSGASLADTARAQYAIAKCETAVHAARLLLHSAAESLQSTAEQRGTIAIEQRALLRAAMTHAAEVSREALVAMYELAGSSALYRGNAMERIFRDGMAALQHANHAAVFMEAAGRVRLGKDVGLPLF